MHERAALRSRENCLVDRAAALFPAQYERPARPPQGLVRRGRHHVGMRHRVRMNARGYQPGDMRRVHHQQGSDIPGYLGPSGEIQLPGVRARTDDYQPRLRGARDAQGLVMVYPLILPGDPVEDRLKEPSRVVLRLAVREMAAVVEVHRKDGVAGFYQRVIRREVGISACMRLHVHVFRAEEVLSSPDSKLLCLIRSGTPPVVAVPRITLRVLVAEDRPLGRQYCGRAVVLRCYQYQIPLLPLQFPAEQAPDFRVPISLPPYHRSSPPLCPRLFITRL